MSTIKILEKPTGVPSARVTVEQHDGDETRLGRVAIVVDTIDAYDIARPCARLGLSATEAASLGAALVAWAADREPIEALGRLGLGPDLGPSWGRSLSDGSAVLVCGLDEHGEPCQPTRMDSPAVAQRLRDPHDHGTMIATVERPTLRAVLADVAAWIEADRAAAAYAIARTIVEVAP